MVDPKVLIGVITGEYARRADFYDYFNMLRKPANAFMLLCHDRSPAHGRNLIIQTALEHNCTHVLFIDDDMTYDADSLDKLLSHNLDIVTGLYLRRDYPHQPLIFDYSDPEGSALYSYLEGDEPRLKPIQNAGLGFCLIKTDVFRKMEKPWVRLGELNSEQWCDDIGFFNRARAAGFEMFCDTECCLGHMGTMIIKPLKENGAWYTTYDTGGKGALKTPQIIPGVQYEFKDYGTN
jgi:hypothetical protein